MEKRKIRAFFISPLFLIAAEIFLSGTIAVGAIFYVYDSVIAVCAWKLALLFADFILSSGAMFALAYFQRHPESKPIVLAAPLFVGAGVFSLLFFPSQAIASAFLNETVTRVFGLVVLLSFYLTCVIVQLYYGTRRNRKFALWATAAVALGVYAASLIFSCKMLPQGKLFKAFSRDLVTFPQASAEEIALNDKDRELSRAWFGSELERSMEGSAASAAFDFHFGDKSFSETRSEWKIETVTREESGGDVTLEKVFTHLESGLEARLFASYYDLTGTSEWKVVLTNRGTKNSPEISYLYGLITAFDFSDPTLYFSGGSDETNDDFALYSREFSGKRKQTYVFDAVKGRSSGQYLPFFNLWGKSPSMAGAIGATIGIGWSGNWSARFAAHKGYVSVHVGQSDLCGYLEPGESVRTPLISLSLYSKGSSPLKGFNNFRADIKRGLGERYAPSSMLLFAGAEGQDDTSRANEAGTRAYIEKLKELDLLETLDYAWYDAAWYDLNGASDWRNAVGNWTVNLDKYPNGLGAVSDYLAENGAKMLLWYEPERVPKSSELYKEIQAKGKADSWLLTANSENCLLNMGCEEAREYIQSAIIDSLKENGVSYYRQDFNIEPRAYWEKADRDLYGGRKGFAENHYVTGEYAFLDALREAIPDLLIDNCASGGRRIDLETCRRAVLLWRSDYACHTNMPDLSEASQFETYGLGFWLPYSSTTNPGASTSYALRSLIGACVNFYADILFDHPETYAAFVRDYERVKAFFAENYYPLTSCAMRSAFVAMQFGTAERGVIIAFDRAGKNKTNFIRPNGLSTNSTYKISLIEGQTLSEKNGKDLMKSGFSVSAGKKSAEIILYEKQAN